MNEFLTLQLHHNSIIKAALQGVEGVTFRTVPDPAGDSGSFLSFFLPTEDLTKAVVAAFAAAGIGGNFYWYDNNWHYIRKWQHLQEGKWMNNIAPAYKEAVLQQVTKSFAPSDAIMSRCISSSISLAWTEEQAKARGAQMAGIIAQVLATAQQQA